MKKSIIISLFAFCAAVCVVSCQVSLVEEAEVKEVKEPVIINLSIPYPALESANGTKVTMDPSTGVTNWVAGDKIALYGKPNGTDGTNFITHEIIASEITDPTVATISVDISDLIGWEETSSGARNFNIAYPADDWSFYSQWTGGGRAGFRNTNQILLAGYVANELDSATLFNLSAVITFKVSGDFDSYIFFGNDGDEVVGYERYLVRVNYATPSYLDQYHKEEPYGTYGDMTSITGPVVGDGVTYNFICIPNEAVLDKGFTIQFVKSGKIKKYITSSKGLTIDHGHYVDLGLLPSANLYDYTPISAAEKAGATDLSDIDGASANCYVVNAGDSSNENKVFKFRTVRGNSYIKGSSVGTSVGSVDHATVLWETWNTDETVTAKSIIKEVDYADNFIYFKMPGSLHAGNAVIAAKDSGDNTLWSWHIWVPSNAYTADDFGISSKDLMSRNLGALLDTRAYDGVTKLTVDVKSYGLLYQWGRKDPFVGAKRYNSSSLAVVSGTAWTNTTDTSFSLEDSYANPTVRAKFNAWNTSEGNASADELWGQSGAKTINDPCPPGYRVPKYNDSDPIWQSVVTLTSDPYNFEADDTYGWWKLGTAVFPMAGWVEGSGSVNYVGTRSKIWSASKLSDSYKEHGITQYIYYSESWQSQPLYGTRRQYLIPVRCAAE